jgi:KDO2-lipid IV(A) lauroyltransferase
MARCLRIGTESRFRIEMRELRVPRTPNQADDVREVLAAMHRQFEDWIREAPEQWLWAHRIWR